MIDVIVPDAEDRQLVHDVIYHELCLGKIRESSKQEFIRIVDALRSMGAEGVILGCTEIGMLIGPGDTPVTLYDTTKIHAAKAVEWALMPSE